MRFATSKINPRSRSFPIPVEQLEGRQLFNALPTLFLTDALLDPVTAVTVTATQGKKFSDVVATWTGTLPTPASKTVATAIINWGDGKSSKAKLVDDGSGTIQITGTHNWAKAGTFQTVVTVDEYPKGHPRQLTEIGTAAGSATVAAKPHALSIKGSISGTYTLPIGNPDARSYDFTGTGTNKSMGAVSLSGSITPPGFILSAPTTGELTLTGSTGTVTIDVTGHKQNGGAPLPQKLAYTVVSGTGDFANAGGKGTIALALNSTAGTFIMVIH